MVITAVITGTERLRAQQLSAFVLNGRIIHDAHMRGQEGKILLNPDLADTAFPVGNIVFRHREITGKIKDP